MIRMTGIAVLLGILLLVGCTTDVAPKVTDRATIPAAKPAPPVAPPAVAPSIISETDRVTPADNSTSPLPEPVLEPPVTQVAPASVPISSDGPGGTIINFVDVQPLPKLDEGFGVQGVRVVLDNVYPGWTGTVPLTLVNGKDMDRMIVVRAVSPSSTTEGFDPFPADQLYWITVDREDNPLTKGETHVVYVTLSVPLDADYFNKREEVRIRIDDYSQGGIVQIALESRWYIISYAKGG